LNRLFQILIVVVFAFGVYSCVNPFAPALNRDANEFGVLGDTRNIDGIFTNWRYAYIFKDTLVYGELLDPEFNFVFRNYDVGVERTWGREDEMILTSRLFLAAKTIDLIWNESIASFGDSLEQDISRGFSLQINFSAEDVVRIQGRAALKLTRRDPKESWKIIKWVDESNF